MPDNKNRSRTDFSVFDHMSTEELEKILRLDAQNSEGDESDTDLTLYIMGILADRDHSEHEKTAEEALKVFRENYYPLGASETGKSTASAEKIHKPKKNKWLRRSLTAAAMVALVLLTTISVQGNRFDFWGEIAKWTQEVFHFGGNFQGENEPYEDDNGNFATLQEALEKKKIPTDIIPTWLPGGYKFNDIQVIESPESTMVIAGYIDDYSNEISIQIKKYLNKHVQQIEKGSDLFEVYSKNGIDYYIFNNLEQCYACWLVDEYECWIISDSDLDDLRKMIDSIGGGN